MDKFVGLGELVDFDFFLCFVFDVGGWNDKLFN